MYHVFTVADGRVERGATVEAFTLSNGAIQIAAILVGERGRGRKVGALAVRGEAPAKPYSLLSAEVGLTQRGNPRLVFKPVYSQDACIVVFRTPIGFGGGNSHTGDRMDGGESFAPFPALEILADGIIAQGDAGNMGSGAQCIAVMPRGIVFRTGYSGRRYDNPDCHYYVFDGSEIRVATWAERQLSDHFDEGIGYE
jgi:hypothetical protein